MEKMIVSYQEHFLKRLQTEEFLFASSYSKQYKQNKFWIWSLNIILTQKGNKDIKKNSQLIVRGNA